MLVLYRLSSPEEEAGQGLPRDVHYLPMLIRDTFTTNICLILPPSASSRYLSLQGPSRAELASVSAQRCPVPSALLVLLNSYSYYNIISVHLCAPSRTIPSPVVACLGSPSEAHGSSKAFLLARGSTWQNCAARDCC